MAKKWERKLVAACMRDPSTITKTFMAGIKGEHLQDKYLEYIFARINHLHQQKLEVTADTVEALIEKDVVSSDDFKSSAIRDVHELAAMPPIESKFTLDFMKQKRVDFETVKIINDAIEEFSKSKDTEKLRKAVARVSLIEQGDAFTDVAYNSKEAYEERKQKRRLERDGKLGKKFKFLGEFAFLNNCYEGGGVKQGTINTVNGPTNVGKSLMLSEFALQGIHPDNGLNVLYIVAENMLDMTLKRFDAQFIDIKYDELNDPDLHEEACDIMFSDEVQEAFGTMHVFKVKLDTFTTQTIEAMLEKYVDTYGYLPDMLCCDSPDHMLPLVQHRQAYLNKGQVFKDIKGLCEDYNIICFATSPSKASAEGKKTTSTADQAGAYDIARLVDSTISYLKNDEDLLSNTRAIKVTKMRDGKMDGLVHRFKITESLRFERFQPRSEAIGIKKIASEVEQEDDDEPHEEVVEPPSKKKGRFARKYNLKSVKEDVES